MKKITYHRIQQVAYKRSVWILLLSIWLFCCNISIVHAQEHTLEPDVECQLCLTNFSHAPFLLSKTYYFTPCIQRAIEIDFLNFQLVSAHHIFIGNRDPPQ